MFNEVAPEFLEVPGRAAKQSVDTIADFAEQIIPIQAVVVFRMPNHRFDGRAAFKELTHLRREIPSARNVHRHSLRMIALPAKALIDKGVFRADSR